MTDAATREQGSDRLDVPGDWRRVSMRVAGVEAVGEILGWGITAGVATLILWFVHEGDMPWWAWMPLVGAFVLAAIGIGFATLRARTIGFLERRDDLLVRRGMLFRRFVAVPYGRMQVVDITQGPIERMFGIKTLKLVTAAATSGVQIPGLTGSAAEELRDRLVAVSESRRAGL